MKKKLKENKDSGKKILIVQQNNFLYRGFVLDFDDSCVEFLDEYTNTSHIIRYDWIKHLENLK